MAYTKVLLLASLVAVALSAPQGITFGPSATYSYRFEGPEQTKEESRDALGNIKGSYSITYPNGGGTLTYKYAHPVTLPVFRTTDDGPLGPAGTVIAIQRQTNSKASAFLIQMLEQRLDSREPPVVTETEAVLIEALPESVEGPTSSVVLEAAESPEPAPENAIIRRPGSLTRDQFINSKESAVLQDIRRESEESSVLGGRSPPIITDSAVIVEAASE